MTTYILGSESGTTLVKTIEKKLKPVIADLETVDRIEDIAADKAGPGKIVMIIPFTNIASIDKFIDVAGRFRDRYFFILVSKEIAASDYKRLVRSGAADWISADGPVQEIVEIIERQQPPADAPAKKTAKPTVITFLPSAGGVGNTTIALEVALHNKLDNRSSRTCYVDLDFQTSHVCDFLDIEPRLQIQEILEQPERLDQQLFELFASHHSSGLDIFAAPRSRLDLCSINLAALDLFLGMISKNYDFIVIDMPVFWLAWTVPVLENSDLIIVTGLNTIPGLRQLKGTVEAASAVKKPTTQISIVVNRATHNLFGNIERRGHADSVLAGQTLFYVREDADAINRLNAGTSAAQSKSGRSVKDFAALAAHCAAVKTSRQN